jgi:hypothetical protein
MSTSAIGGVIYAVSIQNIHEQTQLRTNKQEKDDVR